jgi:DNA repair exonuclease SbcCD ATPase subunit
MQILKIEFKNFNSYGNKIQVIEFPLGQSGFFHVVGQNGFGKTTISEAIKFGLFGKVDGKKLKDIPNRINGGAWVRITLMTKNKQVIVESGVDPSFINLWVDGVPYDKANNRGPREYLTEELLEIPFHVFNNIVSISINDFKSFLKMSNDDKRKIVDKIFGFHIINQMRELLKGQTKVLKDNLDTIVRSMTSQNTNLQSSMNELDNLTKKLNETSDDKILEINESLEKFKNLLEFHKQKMGEFLVTERDFKSELNKLNSMVFASRNQINDISNKLKLYDNQKCPTCASDLTTEFHNGVKEDFNSALEIAKRDFDSNNKAFAEMREKEKEIDDQKRNLIEKESKIKHNINSFSQQLKELQSGPKDEQLESIKKIVSNMEEQIQNSNLDKVKNEERLNWNKIVEDILGEKGLKQMAIKTILPSLNGEIYRLMTEMHLDYKVIFDEEFNATITHLGQDISIATLSRGETKKVDFVVLIAVIKLMKMRFPGINLLFLDEILDGLDEDSIYCVLKTLNETTKSLKLNTMIISHISQFPNETFDYRIVVEKKNNFSNLEIVKIS